MAEFSKLEAQCDTDRNRCLYFAGTVQLFRCRHCRDEDNRCTDDESRWMFMIPTEYRPL